jgi:hypothetical protein
MNWRESDLTVATCRLYELERVRPYSSDVRAI